VSIADEADAPNRGRITVCMPMLLLMRKPRWSGGEPIHVVAE
jgi:hypothetical protein